jgi:hypothetical protein
VTHLRKMMLEELQRRNYAQSTAEAYILALRDLARYHRLPPDRLRPQQIREYQVHLLRDRKLSPPNCKAKDVRHPVLLRPHAEAAVSAQ